MVKALSLGTCLQHHSIRSFSQLVPIFVKLLSELKSYYINSLERDTPKCPGLRASASKEIKPAFNEIFIPIPEDLGPATFPERCIYRVQQNLRSLNPSAYTPNLVSIGPLHHDDKRFQAMEKQKLRYLRDFCERTGMTSFQLAKPIKEKEETIRRCYEETSMFCGESFITMILLDAVFIIELFLKKYDANVEDYILSKPWMLGNKQRDLLILENQLPWFILEDLYNFSFSNQRNPGHFFVLLHCFMGSQKTSDSSDQKQNKLNGDCGFSVLYGHWIRRIFPKSRKNDKDQSGAKQSPEENPNGFQQDSIIREFLERKEAQQEKSILHFLDLLRKHVTLNIGTPKRSQKAVTKLYNATKLHGAGVKFKLCSTENHQLGITFKAGELSMSEFVIADSSPLTSQSVRSPAAGRLYIFEIKKRR